jgi:hypothetical protein
VGMGDPGGCGDFGQCRADGDLESAGLAFDADRYPGSRRQDRKDAGKRGSVGRSEREFAGAGMVLSEVAPPALQIQDGALSASRWSALHVKTEHTHHLRLCIVGAESCFPLHHPGSAQPAGVLPAHMRSARSPLCVILSVLPPPLSAFVKDTRQSDAGQAAGARCFTPRGGLLAELPSTSPRLQLDRELATTSQPEVQHRSRHATSSASRDSRSAAQRRRAAPLHGTRELPAPRSPPILHSD